MEAVILIGIQGAGKTSFYKERFFDTHIRLSLDMLKTRHRESLLLNACIAAKQPFVVDNTNVTKGHRERYIRPASEAGFRIEGYYFSSKPSESLARNEMRTGKQRVPARGVFGTAARLELPAYAECFDRLNYVHISSDGEFLVEDWKDEI